MGTRNQRWITASLALAITATLMTSASLAQTQPMSQPISPVRPATPIPPVATGGATPQVVSPYWNQPRNEQASDVRQAPATPDDLMNATVLAVPAARVQQVIATAQFHRLDSLLNRTTDMVRKDFLESDDYTKAIDHMRSAVADLDHARNEAISGLKETDEYRATVALQQNVTDQIAQERETDNPDPQRLVALAELKLDYATPLRSVEREQIEASDDVRKARDNLRAAATEVEKLEHGFNVSFHKNNDLASLRQQRDDARIARLAANALWYESRVARNIAVNYAYTTHLLDYSANRFGTSPYADAYFTGYSNSPYGLSGLGGYGYSNGPFTLGTFNSNGFFGR